MIQADLDKARVVSVREDTVSQHHENLEEVVYGSNKMNGKFGASHHIYSSMTVTQEVTENRS